MKQAEIKVSKGYQLAPIVQYICTQSQQDQLLKCQPFLRLFETCPNRASVEITPDIPPTSFDYNVLETNEYQIADGNFNNNEHNKAKSVGRQLTTLIVNARELNAWKDISSSPSASS